MYLLALLIIPVLFIYSAFSWGYVLSLLYQWFIIAAIPAAPHFTIVQFIGFSMFCNALIRHESSHIKSEYEETAAKYISGLIGPWIVLCFAWFFRLFFYH